MTSKEVMKIALSSTHDLLKWYVSDLSDSDLLVRPVPNANHIAWQMGHLIAAEVNMMSVNLADVAYPELPAGFREQHDKAAAASDQVDGFRPKQEYLDLFAKVRGATIAAVEKFSDADFDKPSTGTMAKYAPTLGKMLHLQVNHVMMHVGQFTVVRRKLGKPVLF